MLYIVGIGLSPGHLTQEALEAFRASESVYLDGYTSAYSSGGPEGLEKAAGKAVEVLDRKAVEEEFAKILEEAKGKNVALAVYGNPLNATTHIQLLLDARKAGVKAAAIAGISIFDFMAFTGLERYKFGRTTSIVFHEDNYEPEGFYDAILENKKLGLHTMCLLDVRNEEGRMMGITHAISLLERIEERREKSVLSESIAVGMAGMGSSAQQVRAGTMEQLKSCGFTAYPQSLIVCGKLNEKEIEALRELSGLE
ncbi:MAG: diphthine synthase [Candidatus Diapherotrites archaeon]|uniref:Diphthine synthase n=1 Tax=Candidatus Iainarchaeum sp. TaxID=3101447 RepID=A0A8T3YI85_9ARCH|nr:diphthine synthase [Candidatus Diapherotrites archaeon]